MLIWVAVALVQVALGILTIWSQRKVDVTTAHVALGAVTFMIGWMLVLIASREVATVALRPELSTDSPRSARLPTFATEVKSA